MDKAFTEYFVKALVNAHATYQRLLIWNGKKKVFVLETSIKYLIFLHLVLIHHDQTQQLTPRRSI